MARMMFAIPMACGALLTLQATVGLTADESASPIGRPTAFKQGKRAMIGVWYEDGKWNLRMTSKDKGKDKERLLFTGRVQVEGDRVIGEFQGLDRAVKAKNADWVVLHKDGKGFDFQIANFGKADGVNFKAGDKARSVTFKLFVGGDDDPKLILIGTNGTHPAKADFTLPAHPKK